MIGTFRRFSSLGASARSLGAVVSKAVAAALFLSACAYGPVIVGEPPPPPARAHKSVKIPPGHMPPPGKCRIWYPELPPGQQPPPGECRELERRVPPDAILVYGR